MSSLKNQYIVMEYCNGGNLMEKIKNHKNLGAHFTERELLEFVAQMCNGYLMLEKAGILHRDIKPANILIHNGIYKLADFGLI